MASANQTPEQAARDKIDEMLSQSGWVVQDKKKIDFGASLGIAVREYQTDVGPADYVLFVDKKPVGVVEAKPEDWGQKITTVDCSPRVEHLPTGKEGLGAFRSIRKRSPSG